MKHFFRFVFFLPLFSVSVFGQQESLDAFFQSHKNDPGVKYAFLSKDLLDVTLQNDIKHEHWDGLQEVIKNIGCLSVLAAEEHEQAQTLYREAKAAVLNGVFENLLAVKDGQTRVFIWARSEEAEVQDLILLLGTPSDFVLATFHGALQLGNLAELAALFESGKAAALVQNAQSLSADFQISPNPSKGEINLKYADQEDPALHWRVLQSQGKVVLDLPGNEAATQIFLPAHLPSGTYWIELKTRKGKIGVKPLQLIK